MLKKILLKNREIPVPVPIYTLGEAVAWIENTLAKKDTIITSIQIDATEMINEVGKASIREMKLTEDTVVHIKMDSPKDLSIQSLDVVCDLSYAIGTRLKKVAVDCWQKDTLKPKGELEEIHADLSLLLELINHINGLVDSTHSYLGPINGLATLIQASKEKFQSALKESRWQDVSSILVNRIDPYLKELTKEGEDLQFNILTDSLPDESSRAIR